MVCDGETEAVEGVFLLRSAMAPGDLFPGLEVEGGYVRVKSRHGAGSTFSFYMAK